MRTDGIVAQAIRRNLGLEPDDKSQDGRIGTMTRSEQLERYLQWNNVIGYAGIVINAVKEIYGVQLND
jgi:hypothetical protein